jgi:hypothetical protein
VGTCAIYDFKTSKEIESITYDDMEDVRNALNAILGPISHPTRPTWLNTSALNEKM